MRTKVYISRLLPNIVMERFYQYFDVKVNRNDRSATRLELEEGIKWADYLVCLLNDNIDKYLIFLNPSLKAICNYAVGFNNIDILAAKACNLPVTNTPDVLTETTADFAWALLMATARRITEADRIARKGTFPGWSPNYMVGYDIFGKTIGLIGTGRIGSAMAKRSLGFNMNILYSDLSDNEELNNMNALKCTVSDLLKESDFISLHVPLTSETKNIIGKKEFNLMKKNAILINTSRGPIINEEALMWALENNIIAGAALDVFHNEPHITSGMEKFQNLVLSPHIASASIDTRANMGFLVFENILALSNNLKPITPVY